MFRSRLMTIVVVTLALAWGAVAVATAQVPAMLTLDDVQRLALESYEGVNSAREQTEQARLGRRVAGSYLMPSVSVASVLTRNLVTAEFDFGGQKISILPPFDYSVVMTVSQPIFTGLRDIRAREQAQLAIDAAGKNYGNTAQDVVLQVTRAYYSVLGAQEGVEISRRAVALAEQTLRTAESLYRAGEAVETSVLRARVAVSDARRLVLEAQDALVLNREQLAILTGAADEFSVTRPSQPAPLAQPLEDLIQTALVSRPDLQALDIREKIAQLEIRKSAGAYLPSVRADGTYTRRRSNFPSSQLGAVTLNATWTLFNGGRTAAEVATARSQLRQLDLQRDLVRKQAEQQIRAAYLKVKSLAANLDMLTAQVEFARRNAEMTGKAFEAGEATDLDVLDANTTLIRSELQLAMTTLTHEVAIYELQRAIGTFAADRVTAAAGGQQ